MPSFKMKFSGVTILQGVEFSIFPIDFEWALQQCSATALPVISSPLLSELFVQSKYYETDMSVQTKRPKELTAIV